MRRARLVASVGTIAAMASMVFGVVQRSKAWERPGTLPPNAWGAPDSISRIARALTNGAEPALSPNGHSMAFTRNGTSVWIMDLGTSKVRLLRNCGNAHSPTWDPSGRRIAFSGNPGTWDQGGWRIDPRLAGGSLDRYGIWIVNLDGTCLHKLSDGDAGDQYPLWSPDGKWIAWTRGKQIWISDTAGVERRALTSQPAREFEFPISWSPDGAVLLYAASDGGPDFDLRLVSLDGTGQQRDPTGAVSGFPQGMRWSPDGAYLYQSLWALTPGLSITEHRTGGKSRTLLLTRGNGSVGRMAIAGDQSFIVYDNAEPEDDELISIVRLR